MRGANEWKFSCVEDYVVSNGQLFNSVALTPEELHIIYTACDNNKFPIKECFANSQKIVSNDMSGKLVYVEGYASGIIPVHHGWVGINGKVIDLTMRVYEIVGGNIERKVKTHKHRRWPDRVLGVLPRGREYIGVSFTREQVLANMVATKMYQSLIDNWQAGWPLLKGDK